MTNPITKINGVEIVAVEQDGTIYVPIKPICMAVGVAYESQVNKIKEHPILAQTISLRDMVAADGKHRELLCLPLKFVYGWLFAISPANVSEQTKASVIKYQAECCDVLYEHFTGTMRRTIETNNAEIELLKEINTAIADEKEAKSRKKKAEESLAKLRSERLNPQPSLF